MPLLGKKVFTLASNAVNGESEDAPYLIPHTKERFQSKSEYKKRKDLYSQNIWTCRATGHTNLTHEEACKSEKTVMEQLASQFPKCFEKDVLDHVHHSTDSLDILVDKTWLKLHQQFIFGEKVNLKVKVADKLIPAKIVGIDLAGVDLKSSSTCNSPSSDKENSADEKDKEKAKKWVPPKFLPYLYSIELENEAQVIHSVPGRDLQRIERVPSKDTLRHFIRVSALRAGTCATSPWAVNADLVKQYKLVNKFADFFLSPVKFSTAEGFLMSASAYGPSELFALVREGYISDSLSENKRMSEAFKRAQENCKKRKLSNGTQSTAAKKLKLSKSDEKTKNDKVPTKPSSLKNGKDKLTHNSTPKKKNSLKKLVASPKKKPENVISITDSDSEEKVSLSKLKRSSSAAVTDSDSDVPLYQLVEQTPPKKKKKGKENNAASDDEDIPLSKITPSTPKKSALKTGNSTPQKANSLTKNQKSNEKPTAKKTNIVAKNKKKEKEVGKKGGMKQVTLYELTKRGKNASKGVYNLTPQKKSTAIVVKSPPKPPPMPPIVQRLLSCKRDTIYDKMKYSNLLKKAISILSPIHIKNLPEKLREEFEQKKRFIEEKEKMAKMTPEERENYLKEKREQAKKVQKQKILQRLKDQRRRFEDTDLQLTPLPQAKLVPTPDGFPNTLFGDVVMVTEFINCYSGLLMPESEYPIYTDALIKALVGGSSGFTYVSRVLTVLLHTLLQDHIAKPYSELGAKLSDIAVTAYTSSELVRLCLCCDDEEDDATVVPEEYITLLKDSEFYQLDVEQKLCLLRGLCSRVLATYSVQDYMEEQQRNANTLMKQKLTEMKQIAAMKKSEKQGTGGDKSGVNEDKVSKAPDKASGKDDVGAQSHDASPQASVHNDKDISDTGDDSSWGSIVKRRRLLAAKAAAEKEKQEKERLAIREKELQEEKQKEKLRKKQEQISEAISLARMVLRQDPIGTDRHHDRYWVFTNITPGLYVEKGWIGEEINYTVGKQNTEASEFEVSSQSEDEDAKNENSDLATPKSVYRARRHAIETSFPRPGQNLWFTYRSQKDLDGLLKSLHPQGIRESWLKAEIKKRYDDISRAIIQAQRTNLELRDCDGDTEMLAAFKKELSDMELRLRNGGLGGVPNYDKWEAELMEASDVSILSESLLKVKDGILEKFLQGFMKPITKPSDASDDIKEENGEEKKNEGGEKEKPHEKEDKTEKAVREWKEQVEHCQTMSRLHVLMALLDSCVKWEKSAENAKCKICRKKCNDAQLLLCDECNQAFHMYCLRPALTKLPSGDWFCPACKPRKPELRSLESDSEEEEEKEDACRECGGSEKLIVCSKCPAAFHTHCHDPPLRHAPRGVWECADCKSGVNSRRRSGKLSRKAAPKLNYTAEETPSEEDEDSDDDDYVASVSTPANSKSSRSHKQQEPPRGREKQQRNSTNQSGRTPRAQTGSRKNNSTAVTSSPRGSRRGPSELSLCEDILHKVMKHSSSWPFLEPVDKKLVPDYYTLIKKPMDFQTMLKKCTRLSYASPQEFIEDAALVFENAEAYNKTESEVYTCMQEVEKLFKEALHKLLPDWPYYRTVADKDEGSSGSETGRRRSRNK